MSVILYPLLIFCLRCIDVPAGTIRVIYMVRGQRVRATLLSVIEAGAYIVAVVTVIQDLKDHPMYILAYVAGYSVGTYIGITIEKWIASGWIVARIASRESAPRITERLRQEQFGVTILRGEGREGEVSMLFVVAPRRRGDEMLRLVREIEPDAFVTVDPVSQAIGGYLPHVGTASLVRK